MEENSIDLLALILKGGPVMILLLVLSVISLAIIIIKTIQFYKSDLHNVKKLDEAINLIENNKIPNAKKLLKSSNHNFHLLKKCFMQ